MPFGGLLTLAIVGGAGSIISGAMGASASKDAAALQVAGADRAATLQAQSSKDALAFAKQSWSQQQANVKPWISYGRGAVKTLGDLMGIKPDDAPEVPAAATSADLSTPTNMGGATGAGRTAPAGAETVGQAVPRGTPPTTPPPGRSLPPSTDDPPSSGPVAYAVPRQASSASAGDTGTRRIAWPDGTKNEVPANQVQQYVSLGAKEI